MFFEILSSLVDIETFARGSSIRELPGFENFTVQGVGESEKGSQTFGYRMVLYEQRRFTGTKRQASEKKNSRLSVS